MDIIHPADEIRVSYGDSVSLHFSVSLPNGAVIDSTFDKAPATLTIGDGSLLDGFEKVLIGLKAGDTRSAHLPAAAAFGEWNSDNVQTFSRSQFALSEPNPSVGMMMEFADKGQNSLVGVISGVNDDTVTVDFNHPLAGQEVLFKVQICRVTPKGQVGVMIS